MTDTGFSLDWFSFTIKGTKDMTVAKALSFGSKYSEWIPCNAVHGYTHAKQHPLGHIVMSNNKRPDMGVHCMMTGRALRALVENGIDTFKLISWAMGEGARITRLDLAIDLHETPVDIIGLSSCSQVKGEEGSARKWNLLTGSDTGVTLYVGSRKSDKFMRVYNKAAQMNMPGIVWTRFELEVKGDTCRTIAAAISGLSVTDASAYVKGLMRALFNPVDSTYQRVMDAPSIAVPSTKDASDKTIEWLLNSVAKTMATQIRFHPDVDLWNLFVESVHANLDNMGAFSEPAPDSD